MTTFNWIHILILIATIAAIIVGPIWAVKITRRLDREHERKNQKFEVLRGLMKTRRLQLHPDHVGALNLIQLEFYENEPVISRYRTYIEHLHMSAPTNDETESFFDARHALFVELLRSVAHEMDYTFDKLDLDRLGYTPRGWETDELRNRANSHLLNELLQGKRALPVTEMKAAPESRFPPPPKINDDD